MPLAEHGNARVDNGARQLKIMCCHCFRSAAAAATTTPVLLPLLPLLTQRQQRRQHGRSCLARPLQLHPRGQRRLPLCPLLPSRLLSAALSFAVPTSLILPCPDPLALPALAALAALTALDALALAALTLTCYVISTLVLILQVFTCTSWYYTWKTTARKCNILLSIEIHIFEFQRHC